jgi:hypothetical protein
MSLVRYSASLEVIQNLYMFQQTVSQAQNGHAMFFRKKIRHLGIKIDLGENIIYTVFIRANGKLVSFKYIIA